MDKQETESAPGEKALLAMKNLSKTVSIFKIPKPPIRKPVKQQILTEERYIEELGKIIQRDFFPDLEKLKAQNQYLDAIEKNDVIKLREIYAKYSGRRPSKQSAGFESPATFETPLNRPDSTPNLNATTERSDNSTRPPTNNQLNISVDNPSDKHSIDSFLTQFTSEDNQSFQEIIENADQKLRQKFAVLYDAENTHAKQKALCLALPGIEEQYQAIEGAKTIDTWTYKNKNYIMYVPDGVDITPEEKLEMAKRKQEIVYGNTRLQNNPFDEQQSKETITELAKNQAKGLSGKIGVDGNAIHSAINNNIRGFSLVRTPSPCPGITDSPLMTWGEIEGTPFRLDGSDTPVRPSVGPSFRITETSRRENIALELAEKAGERMRDQKAKAIQAARRNIQSPRIRSTFDRMATMSPAAKRLATSRLGIHTDSLMTPSPGRKSSITSLSKYLTKTPKSLVRKSNTPSPLVMRKSSATSSISSGEQQSCESNNNSSIKSLITDDLLNIPTITSRCKASDFF